MDDIEQKLDKFESWVRQSGIHIQKINMRQWGGFQVGLSWDAKNFIAVDLYSGASFTIERAAARVLYYTLVGQPDNEQFKNWLGTERYSQLQNLLKEPEIPILENSVQEN